ncbi:MAG: rhodanese-like domain-containing protein [Bacteroidetes bacterium]|nr:rhodanese-like domain-containing protein [Bacteroidota bacterium]
MKLNLISGIILFITVVASCSAQTQRLNPDEFEKKSANEQTIIVDIRTPQEFAAGHLKNAININFYSPDFVSSIEKAGKNKNVLIYCASGNRSGQALQKLKNNSFNSLADLQGGISAWNAAGKQILR